MGQPLHIAVNLLHAQPTLTGTGHYAHQLVDALLRLPESPHVTGIASPHNAASFRLPGRTNYRLLRWGRPWNSVMARRLEEWAFLNGAIRDLKPSVFFSPSNFLPLWRTGPMVVTVHDMTFFDFPKTLPRTRCLYWQAWTRRTLRVADAILTATEAARGDIVRHTNLDPDCITIVPHGTGRAFYVGRDDAGRAARAARLRASLPELPERYVFFLGTLAGHKNVPRLIEAVARARTLEGGEGMHLVLAGKPGTDYAAVQETIRRCAGDAFVHELGYVEDALLPALYENARVHVLPSFTEGFGLPIIEAMAAGTPVVTSDRGAMAEVAGNAAELADPYDTEDLAQAIHRLWTDDALRAKRREAGIARAEAFSWDASARKTMEVFRRVVDA